MEQRAIEIDIKKVKHYLEEKDLRARKQKENELNRLIYELQNLRPIWQKYQLERVYLYGSLVDHRTHPDSDVDIAIEGNLEYRQLLHLFGEIGKYFNREVDLRNLKEIPFKEAVKKKGIIVYEKQTGDIKK